MVQSLDIQIISQRRTLLRQLARLIKEVSSYQDDGHLALCTFMNGHDRIPICQGSTKKCS